MSQSLTVSAGTLMLAVPGLIALGGVVVGVALNGWLTTGIEVARLNADNDERTARWLFLRGYRMSPHAGREPVAAIESAPHVTGELVAVDGVEVDKDSAADQHDGRDIRFLLAMALTYLVYAPAKWAARWWFAATDGMGQVMTDATEYVRERWLMSNATRDRIMREEGVETGGTAQVLVASGYELDIADETCRCVPNRDEPHCSCPPALDIADEDELQVELEAWVKANPPTNPAEDEAPRIEALAAEPRAYRGRHWAAGTEHTGLHPIVVPAQREGGDQ